MPSDDRRSTATIDDARRRAVEPRRGLRCRCCRDSLHRGQAPPDGDAAQPRSVVIFALLQPIMFIVLFYYVFGGSIEIPGIVVRPVPDARHLRPDRRVRTRSTPAIGLAEDMQKGFVDRLRSLPDLPVRRAHRAHRSATSCATASPSS